MSGGGHFNPIKNISSAFKSKNLKQFLKSDFVDPLGAGDKLKKIGGSIMGTRAAREQAKAMQEQTENQQKQYEQQLQTAQNQNQLDSSGDVANVATVTAGGTAQDADSELSTRTKKNRQNAISATLGL